MSNWDLYTDLMKIIEEHDEKVRKMIHDQKMTVKEFMEKVNEINELTVLDVRHHLMEYTESVFGKKTN